MPNQGHNPTIGGGGFHHVAIRARDFDATVRFYTQGLGFVEKIRWGEPGAQAVMLDTGDGNYLEVFSGRTEDAPEGALLHVALRTGDCDAAYRRALEAGAKSVSEPRDVTIQGDVPTPVRIAFVKCPDGEVIEFFQNERL